MNFREEEKAPFLPDSVPVGKPTPTSSRNGLILCLAISVMINILAGLSFLSQDTDKICSRYTQQYKSPIMDAIAVKYEKTTYNGTFIHDTIYRQDPGPEVDQAWHDLGTHNKHYVIPEHKAEEYGLDPRHTKVSPDQGGGFPVLFEFEHHLHCIDILRKSTWFNAPYYFEHAGNTSFGAGRDTMKKHTNHCVDILRQVVMCQPDLGVFGQYWVKEIDGPFVDFDTKHKCKNFQEIKDWVVGHQWDGEEELKVRFRDGDLVLDTIP